MANIEINKILTNINLTNTNNTGRIKYIVWHYTGGTGGARENCNYFASTYVGASAHYFIDFDGSIYQSVEDADTAWSLGASTYIHPACRNSNSLNIELCVRKRSTKTMNATDKDWYFEDATVIHAIELTKYLMKKYSVPVSNIIRHYDVTGKICPNPMVYDNGKYKWADVKAALQNSAAPGVTSSMQIYRVRKSWTDTVSQLGAYNSKDNAIKNCPNGYKVFDKNGNIVYTAPSAKGLQASGLKGLSKANAIKKVAPLYVENQKKTGLLASVGIARFCLESDYGTADFSLYANNVNGMKISLSGNIWAGSVWDGKSIYTKKIQQQDKNGNVHYINKEYRKYPYIEDSIADQAAYLINAMNGTKKRYPGIAKEKNYKKVVQIIKNGDHTTPANYVSMINSLIEQWKLTEYDVKPPTANKYKVGSYINCRSYYREPADPANKVINKPLSGNITKSVSGRNPYQIDHKYYVNEADILSVGFLSYTVKVTVTDLKIYSNAGSNYLTKGYTGIGAFTVVKEKTDTHGRRWGLLKSYEKSQNGWIELDRVVKI